MGARVEKRYVLPHPASIDTRTYPTELPEGNYAMLRNLDIPQNIGGWVTRKGFSRLSSTLFGDVRGGVRWYYGTANSQFIISAGFSLQVYTIATDTWTDTGSVWSDSAIWQFPYSQDLLFILNGVNAVGRWDGTNFRNAGFVAPSSAPTTAAGAAGVLTGNYQWVVTFVYDSVAARESSASAASTVLALTAQQGTVTIPTGPTGTTSRNIYRTIAGGTLFQFVATVADNVTTTYNDNIADTALGTNQAPTDNNPPPSGAQFGLFWRGRFVVARTPTNPQRVFFSAITNTEKSPGGGGLSLHGNGIEIFPSSHFIDVGDDNTPITGLAIIMDQLVVFKANRIYNVQGDDAIDFNSWVAQGETGCIAPKTIKNVGNSIMFLGRSDGVPTVYAYDGYQAQPLSSPIEPTLKAKINNLGFTDNQSLFNQPSAFRYRGMYGLCYPTSVAQQTFEIAVLDMRPPQPRWQYLDFGTATAGAVEWISWNGPGDSGQLYFCDVVVGAIYQWDTGVQDVIAPAQNLNIVATIKTKPLDLDLPGVWKQVQRIEVEGLAVTGTTVKIDRSYNRDTAVIAGDTLSLAAPVDDVRYKNLAKATQDCRGADDPDTSPDQGELVQLTITLTGSSSGQAEASKIIVYFTVEPTSEVRRPS